MDTHDTNSNASQSETPVPTPLVDTTQADTPQSAPPSSPLEPPTTDPNTLVPASDQPAPPQAAASPEAAAENPNRDFVLAYIFNLLVGGLGVDRFYLGKYTTAILKLLTAGGLGIWVLIDSFLIAFGVSKQKNDNRYLHGYDTHKTWTRILTFVWVFGWPILMIIVFVPLFFLALS